MRLLTLQVAVATSVWVQLALAEPAGGTDQGKTPIAPVQEGMPRWLKVGAQVRGRTEFPTGIGFAEGSAQYFLSRIRLDATVKPSGWLLFFAQAQDSRAAGYTGEPPASVQDPFELRQAYAQVGSSEERISLRVGRQTLHYLGGRLISTGDWGNTAKTFDAALVSVNMGRKGKLDLFGGSVLLPDGSRFDRRRPGEHLYGADWLVKEVLPGTTVESFVFAKQQKNIIGETGLHGNAITATTGFRISGRLPGRMDFAGLFATQNGHYATDRVSALAGDYLVGWTVSDSGVKPRLSVELYHASGDDRSGDGRRNTFDQLYGAFHYFLGVADRVGWKNSRNLRTGLDMSFGKKCKAFLDVRELWLATTQDALYDASGTKSVLNTKATSRRIGRELDGYAVYTLSRYFSLEGGAGYLRPGAFLRQSGRNTPYLYSYVMWTMRL